MTKNSDGVMMKTFNMPREDNPDMKTEKSSVRLLDYYRANSDFSENMLPREWTKMLRNPNEGPRHNYSYMIL